ncbi:MAG: transcription antitermination factor NusB [Elusimicrobia bacterium]|nr:transcription antitermination factor NusB [Elusimicrobiota bacterium]
MGLRRQARELALQALYLHDMCGFSKEAALNAIGFELLPGPLSIFSKHLLSGVLDRQEEIDTLIRRYTENWDIRRMAAIDRNILRISTFEILTDLETPISVIIDEAIEISKNYSTEDSSKFVNGILDKIKKERKI